MIVACRRVGTCDRAGAGIYFADQLPIWHGDWDLHVVGVVTGAIAAGIRRTGGRADSGRRLRTERVRNAALKIVGAGIQTVRRIRSGMQFHHCKESYAKLSEAVYGARDDGCDGRISERRD